VRSFARIMMFGGVLLFLLAAYSQTGHLDKANQVGDVLAMGMSLLVSMSGLTFLLVTRRQRHADDTHGQLTGGGAR
jgi:hypothetical protein